MIYLGSDAPHKAAVVTAYCEQNAIDRVVVCSPAKFDFDLSALAVPVRFVDWPEIIMYRTFYPLLQEIDGRTLVVVNECLRVQKRHDLTYNCIRHYLSQTVHVLVFQWLPCIDGMGDFMTLFDFATGSKYKREPYSVGMLERVTVQVVERAPVFRVTPVVASERIHADYARERAKLFANVGASDPHTIPRNLYLMGGKAKLASLPLMAWCVGRNNRFKVDRMAPYKEDSYPCPLYVVFELPHNFIDFSDMSALARQTEFEVLATDLRADAWYIGRYAQWAERIKSGYADLRQFAQCA